MPDDRPRLSLCVIAKDEAHNLPRCLASVEGVVDEIVVTDTGSTDDTARIAEDAGAVVHRFPWCDDFAAAYNACFERARGAWIFMLDADEALSDGCTDEVARLVRDDTAIGHFVLRRDYYGEDARADTHTEMLQLRLFRNHPGARYVGRIHQQFRTPLEELGAPDGRTVKGSGVRIDHYGYMGDLTTQKLERSIRLLEMELAERPGRFYYVVELARCKIKAGDTSGVEDLAHAASMLVSGEEAPDARAPAQALLFEQILALDCLPEGFPMTWERAAELGRSLFPDTVPIEWHIARRRFAQGRHEEAVRVLERIIELGENGRYNRMCSFEPGLLRGDATLNLGVGYAHLGRIEDAIACLERLRSHPVHGEAASANIRALADLNP